MEYKVIRWLEENASKYPFHTPYVSDAKAVKVIGRGKFYSIVWKCMHIYSQRMCLWLEKCVFRFYVGVDWMADSGNSFDCDFWLWYENKHGGIFHLKGRYNEWLKGTKSGIVYCFWFLYNFSLKKKELTCLSALCSRCGNRLKIQSDIWNLKIWFEYSICTPKSLIRISDWSNARISSHFQEFGPERIGKSYVHSTNILPHYMKLHAYDYIHHDHLTDVGCCFF